MQTKKLGGLFAVTAIASILVAGMVSIPESNAEPGSKKRSHI